MAEIEQTQQQEDTPIDNQQDEINPDKPKRKKKTEFSATYQVKGRTMETPIHSTKREVNQWLKRKGVNLKTVKHK